MGGSRQVESHDVDQKLVEVMAAPTESEGAVSLRVSGMAGQLCEVKVCHADLGSDVKMAIERETEIQASQQHLIVESCELGDNETVADVLPEGASSAEVLLIRRIRYDGAYTATPTWNGPRTFTISGSTVEIAGNFFPIEWDDANP